MPAHRESKIMIAGFKQVVRNTISNIRRHMSHGDLIEQLLEQHLTKFPDNPVFIETGGGESTISLVKMGKSIDAKSLFTRL
jgi:hypothetical protein